MVDRLLAGWDGEALMVRRDAVTETWMLIAIHSTVLGPAAGGTRMKSYPDLDAAVTDVLRLSEGMTYKFAAPGLPFGGGKAVLMVPEALDPNERPGLLRRFGAMIAELDGAFLTGPDVGTTPADMDVIAETAGPRVFCRTPQAGGAGDPGPYTARGVFAAIAAVCAESGIELAAGKVVVQGVGDVGGPLLRMLVAAGADVAFGEVDGERVRRYAEELPVEVLDPDTTLAAECDVLAPCALGGVLNATSIPALRCRGIAGSANNQLADPADGAALAGRGIVYAPDFIANVGGAMAMPGLELLGWSPEYAEREVEAYVTSTLAEIFALARSQQLTPDEAARQIAARHLAGAEV